MEQWNDGAKSEKRFGIKMFRRTVYQINSITPIIPSFQHPQSFLASKAIET